MPNHRHKIHAITDTLLINQKSVYILLKNLSNSETVMVIKQLFIVFPNTFIFPRLLQRLFKFFICFIFFCFFELNLFPDIHSQKYYN